MRPKKTYKVTTLDFSKFTDSELLDMGPEFEGKFDSIFSELSPSSLKQAVGLFFNLYWFTIELKKRFPDKIEELEETLLMHRILSELNISTNE